MGKDKNQSEDQFPDGLVHNDFISIEELVYAPLQALSEANQQLRMQVIENIRKMGRVEQVGKEEIIYLDHINVAYDQLKQEADGYSVDNLQVEIPLISILSMNQLNVDKAEISFSTEVKAMVDKQGQTKEIYARICSPSQRESDFLPKISYQLQVNAIPATEGILRLVDSLSSSQVAKKLNTRPVAITGEWGSEEQKKMSMEVKQLKAKIMHLKQLYQKIDELIAEQDRLREISDKDFVEDTYDFDRDKYLMAQSNIVNRIMEYQEKVMNLEIKFGLENDYT